MVKKLIKKICLLGDGSVGKTSLIRRFVDNSFSEDYLVTLECNISKKNVSLEDNDGSPVNVGLQIWDIMGHKGLTTLHTNYFSGAKGALVVCDVTRDATLDSLGSWIEPLRKAAGEIPVVILANKSDLIGKEELGIELAQFGEEAVINAAKKWNSPHYLTSAKSGLNVQVAFETIGSLMIGGAAMPPESFPSSAAPAAADTVADELAGLSLGDEPAPKKPAKAKNPELEKLAKQKAAVEDAYKSGKLSEKMYKKNLARIEKQEKKAGKKG